mgnify:CR=1 FL=1
MKEIKFTEEECRILTTIIGITEGDIAPICYKLIYQPLKVMGTLSKEEFYTRIINGIEKRNIIDKTILFLKTKDEKERIKNDDDSIDELDSKISNWIGQISSLLNWNLNKDYLVEALFFSFANSHIYEICKEIDEGNYNGYIEYMRRIQEK